MITWSIPSLASGVTATLTLVVQPTQTGTVTNTAMAQANEPDSDPADNSSSESTTITPGTDLKVTVSDGKTTVVAGQIDTYTIKVTNVGPGDVTGATEGVQLTNIPLEAAAGVQRTGTTHSFTAGFAFKGNRSPEVIALTDASVTDLHILASGYLVRAHR